jgi:hypothetical protein
MTTHAPFSPTHAWPAGKWRQQALRLGRYLGLLAEEAPIPPPTRRQQLMAEQDRRRAEQRRAAAMPRGHR